MALSPSSPRAPPSVDAYARVSKHIGFAFQVFNDVSRADRWLTERGQPNPTPRVD